MVTIGRVGRGALPRVALRSVRGLDWGFRWFVFFDNTRPQRRCHPNYHGTAHRAVVAAATIAIKPGGSFVPRL